MKKMILALFAAAVMSQQAMAYDDSNVPSFSKTKQILSTQIYKPNEPHKTIYVACDIERQGKKMVPVLESCNYVNRKPNNLNRAERIEWEHIVPAAHIGYQNKCMIENKSRKDKRNYCESVDPEFRRAYVDMFNLVPSVGEVNLDRSNFRFAELTSSDFDYCNGCGFMISFKGKSVTPPAEVKGDIARTYLYMSDRYNINLSDSQRKMFEAWNKMDPVSAWEIEKNKRVKKIQGNSNPYIQNLD